MAKVMFAPCVTIYKIFTIQIKCQTFDLENEGEIQDLYYSIANSIDIAFFSEF